MPPLLSLATLVAIAAASANVSTSGYLGRARATAARMNHCAYVKLTGTWLEALWQSGNTLEAMANLAIASENHSAYADLFAHSFSRTPVIVG